METGLEGDNGEQELQTKEGLRYISCGHIETLLQNRKGPRGKTLDMPSRVCLAVGDLHQVRCAASYKQQQYPAGTQINY